MIKIGLERLDTQEGITVEALLDSGATGLVIVKIADDRLYFIFSFHFILFSLFYFLFLFLFIEQLRLGFISHAVTSVTN